MSKYKVNQEFKDEVNKELKETDYVGKKLFVRGVALVMAIAVIYSGCYYGWNKYKKHVDRQIFKQSIAYNESAAEFLADAYYQYNTSESNEEKNQISSYVRAKYPNLDVADIDNSDLKSFYRMCLGGK